MRSAYQLDCIIRVMDTKIRRRSMTILVTSVSVSVVLLGVSLATELSSYSYYSSDLYKQAACMSKVLGFAQEGVIRDVGGFDGGIFECTQIQWSGSIY
jgi:hypothetical protein